MSETQYSYMPIRSIFWDGGTAEEFAPRLAAVPLTPFARDWVFQELCMRGLTAHAALLADGDEKPSNLALTHGFGSYFHSIRMSCRLDAYDEWVSSLFRDVETFRRWGAFQSEKALVTAADFESGYYIKGMIDAVRELPTPEGDLAHDLALVHAADPGPGERPDHVMIQTLLQQDLCSPVGISHALVALAVRCADHFSACVGVGFFDDLPQLVSPAAQSFKGLLERNPDPFAVDWALRKSCRAFAYADVIHMLAQKATPEARGDALAGGIASYAWTQDSINNVRAVARFLVSLGVPEEERFRAATMVEESTSHCSADTWKQGKLREFAAYLRCPDNLPTPATPAARKAYRFG